MSKLAEKALLVHLSGHQWTGRKKDKKVSQDVCVRENADTDAGAWWTYLVPQKELKPINTAWGRVDRKFREMTLPYLDGGLRILPSNMLFEFRDKLKKPIADYDHAVDTFLKRWPEIVKNAPNRLGDLINGQRLPTVDELRLKFYIRQDILPVPEVTGIAGLVEKITAEQAAEVREDVTNSINSGTARATRELYARLGDFVGKVADTMNERSKKFRDSLITNLKDFCELIPKYNVMDCAELETLRQDVMSKLANLDPEDLREIPNNRKKAGAEANALLEKINDYIR